MDLAKILKFAPDDLKLYSRAHGEVSFIQVNDNMIECMTEFDELLFFDSEGRLLPEVINDNPCVSYINAQPMLLPAKSVTHWEDWWEYLVEVGTCITDDYRIAIYIGNDVAMSPGYWTMQVSNMQNPRFPSEEEVSKFWGSNRDVSDVIKYNLETKTFCVGDDQIVWFEDDTDFIESFDPKGFYLESGDTVVVRNDYDQEWTLDFFSYCELMSETKEKSFRCVGGWWNYCVPFNDATKQLIGTTNQCKGFFARITNKE